MVGVTGGAGEGGIKGVEVEVGDISVNGEGGGGEVKGVEEWQR